MNLQKRRLREERTAGGLCYQCGKEKPELGRRRCRACVVKDRERQSRKPKALIPATCRTCGGPTHPMRSECRSCVALKRGDA